MIKGSFFEYLRFHSLRFRMSSPPTIRWKTELIAGLSTSATMVYILCLQPEVMAGNLTDTPTGLPLSALLTTTAFLAAIGAFLTGFIARSPLVSAPALGANFFVVAGIIPVCASLLPKEEEIINATALGLGVVFFAGLLFLILSLLGMRKILIDRISPSIKMAHGIGIGLIIAEVGLKSTGWFLIEGSVPRLGTFFSHSSAVFLTGLILYLLLALKKIPGAILWGILAATAVATLFGEIHFSKILSLPPNPLPVLGKVDLLGVIKKIVPLLPLILILTLTDIIATFGTVAVLGAKVNRQADRESRCAERLFISDSLATMLASFVGHSPTTIYMESAAGIASGGKSGRTSIVVGLLFLIAPFFTPILLVIGGYSPITSWILVVIGAMMCQEIAQIQWKDLTEALPAALIIGVISMTQSIPLGIISGLGLWPWMKLFCGRKKEIHWFFYPLSIILIISAKWVR